MSHRRAAPLHRSRLEWLALVAVLISAFTLRIYDLNWDQGKFLHPDELFVTIRSNDQIHFDWPPDWAQIKDPDSSPFNPRSKTCGEQPCNYSYGALPLLITDFAAETLANVTGGPWDDFDHIPRVGRSISALVDTITVLLVFLVGSRLFDRRVGLLAAAIYGFTPLAIQLSHFYTTDIWLACFVTLTIWCSLLALERERHGWFILAGASFGLAMASKGSVLLLAGVVTLAAIFVAYRSFNLDNPAEAIISGMTRLFASGIASLLAFAVFEPYALMRASTYIDQLREQQQMSSGQIDFPFTRRYVGTTPVVYQVEQLTKWGMGPVAALLGYVGVAMMIWWAVRRRRADIAILLGWLALQLIVILTPQVKFLRYEIPIVPVLAIGGALVIWTGYRWLAARWNRGIATMALVACLFGIGIWTAAFTSIYVGDHPRIAASKWIYANIPMGSTIGAESWDDALPVGFGPMLTQSDMQYNVVGFDIYGDRPQQDVADYLYQQLSDADYVVLSSNRLIESVRQLPWRYPVQIRYYELLESGQLGYSLAADFHTEPSIGPFAVDDSLADESWVNYDHPRVLIFQKTTLVDRATYQQLMTPAIESDWKPTRLNEHEKTLLLDEPVGTLPLVDNYRWSERWTSNSGVALGVWVGLLVLFGLIGRQWSRLLFPRFPDGGAGMSRVLTLILAGWLLWFLASLKIISFSVAWSWIALGTVAAAGFGLWWFLAERRRVFPKPAIAGAEIAFWAVFTLFLVFRWINPDSWHPIWGGEKPMEFAHLNATLRSAHFPPYDPWFSGGYINYYYYGLYLVAYCIKLTGIPAEIAFNLAQPTIMGLMASGAYTLAAALASTRRKVSLSVATGLLATTLVVLVGNLADFFNVLKAWPDGIAPTFGQWTWDPSRAIANTITEFPYFTGLYADLHAHGINVPISLCVLAICLSFVRDPYLTTLSVLRPRFTRDFLTFLVRLGLLALGVGSVATTNSWDLAEYVAFTAVAIFLTTIGIKPLLLRLSLTALLTGLVGAVAAMLFAPFYANYVALFSSLGETRDKTSVIQFASHLGGLLAIVGIGGATLLFTRLRDRISWFVIDPILPLTIVGAALLAAIATNLGMDSNSMTVRLATIVVCGILAVPSLFVISERAQDWLVDLAKGLVITALVGETVLVVDGRGVLALALAFFTLGAVIWLFLENRAERFVGAMIACAAGVFGAIEIVYLQDNLAGGDAYRMNTVFKFYNQVWVLLAIAGAVTLGRAMAGSGLLGWISGPIDIAVPAPQATRDNPDTVTRTEAVAEYRGVVLEAGEQEPREVAQVNEIDLWEQDDRMPEADPAPVNQHALMRKRWSRATVAVGLVVIAMSLFYPALATRPRLEERFAGHPGPGTLNGYDWMRYGTIVGGNGDEISFEGDREAIYWFIDNVQGSPVIMEASIGPYRGNGSRFSINTGLPAVIGWGNHETQQRYPEDIGPRESAVREFYATTDLARKREILATYDVEYVIVGDVERYTAFDGNYWADPAGIAAIDELIGTDLEVAFESSGTTVYRVLGRESANVGR